MRGRMGEYRMWSGRRPGGRWRWTAKEVFHALVVVALVHFLILRLALTGDSAAGTRESNLTVRRISPASELFLQLVEATVAAAGAIPFCRIERLSEFSRAASANVRRRVFSSGRALQGLWSSGARRCQRLSAKMSRRSPERSFPGKNTTKRLKHKFRMQSGPISRRTQQGQNLSTGWSLPSNPILYTSM